MKTYRLFHPEKFGQDDFVTHADYRVLEEEHSELDTKYEKALSDLFLAREELASLRARVGELVEVSVATWSSKRLRRSPEWISRPSSRSQARA